MGTNEMSNCLSVCCLFIIWLMSVSVGHRAPPARSGHRCVADNTNLYVFGGYNPDYDESGGSENEDYPLFRELWRFHFATGTWQQIRTEGFMPTELASMSGNILFVCVFFWGGDFVSFFLVVSLIFGLFILFYFIFCLFLKFCSCLFVSFCFVWYLYSDCLSLCLVLHLF